MKNNKWLRVTLTILLSLAVLAGVAGISFRMGAMQGANLVQTADGATVQGPFFGPMRRFEQNFGGQPGNQQGYGPGMMFARGGDQRMMQGFDRRGFDRGHGGFLSPVFGLLQLAILGGLLWLVYKWVKNSGWKITREPAAAPVTAEEKKE